MRNILNANLSFGAVTVPVGVATAAKRQEVEFRTLHDADLSPAGKDMKCKLCGEVLDEAQMVKGYEFAKNQYVVIETDDLDKLKAERSKVIEIKKFVPWGDVDDLMVEKNYYLTPNELGALAKPYVLLSRAMNDASVVAVAKSVLWGKENPAMIWPTDEGALVLSILYCHDELVDPQPILDRMKVAQPTEDEVALTSEYVSMHVSTLNPQEDLVSKSRDRLNDFIAAKTQGQDFNFEEAEDELEVTIDFMTQLRHSIEQGKKVTA